MRMVYGRHGGGEMHTGFGGGGLRTERIGASWKAYIILYRWDDIIKIGFIVMVMDGMHWIQLSDDRDWW
jgi:hypothetical protein